MIGYLAAVLAFRVALELCRFLFAPDRPALRVVPMSDEAARFWTRWTAWLVGWFAFGYVTIEHLLALGVSLPSCQLLAYVLGFGLLAIALRMVWRPMAAARRSGRVRATILVLLIWLVWIAGYKPLMWALIVIAALPVAIRAAHGAVQHLFRREGEVDRLPEAALPPAAILLDRGLRFLLIAFAVALLVWGWGLDVGALASAGIARRPAGPGPPPCRGHRPGRRSPVEARAHRDRSAAGPVASQSLGTCPTCLPTRRGAGRGCGPCSRSCASCSSWCSPRPRF